MATIKTVCGAFLSISLAGGCTSVEKVLPRDGPTMLDIYEGHVAATGAPASGAPAEPAGAVIPDIEAPPGLREASLYTDPDTELIGYTRTASSEIEALFPELPNPRIVMYVFPHLATKDRLPVPGYATAFSMYERAEFALPGEVAPVASPRPDSTLPPPRDAKGPVHRASFDLNETE